MKDKELSLAIQEKANEINELFKVAEERDLYIKGSLSIMPFHSNKAPSVKLIIKRVYRETVI